MISVRRPTSNYHHTNCEYFFIIRIGRYVTKTNGCHTGHCEVTMGKQKKWSIRMFLNVTNLSKERRYLQCGDIHRFLIWTFN